MAGVPYALGGMPMGGAPGMGGPPGMGMVGGIAGMRGGGMTWSAQVPGSAPPPGALKPMDVERLEWCLAMLQRRQPIENVRLEDAVFQTVLLGVSGTPTGAAGAAGRGVPGMGGPPGMAGGMAGAPSQGVSLAAQFFPEVSRLSVRAAEDALVAARRGSIPPKIEKELRTCAEAAVLRKTRLTNKDEAWEARVQKEYDALLKTYLLGITTFPCFD